jgi:hypothetical protein
LCGERDEVQSYGTTQRESRDVNVNETLLRPTEQEN